MSFFRCCQRAIFVFLFCVLLHNELFRWRELPTRGSFWVAPRASVGKFFALSPPGLPKRSLASAARGPPYSYFWWEVDKDGPTILQWCKVMCGLALLNWLLRFRVSLRHSWSNLFFRMTTCPTRWMVSANQSWLFLLVVFLLLLSLIYLPSGSTGCVAFTLRKGPRVAESWTGWERLLSCWLYPLLLTLALDAVFLASMDWPEISHPRPRIERWTTNFLFIFDGPFSAMPGWTSRCLQCITV